MITLRAPSLSSRVLTVLVWTRPLRASFILAVLAGCAPGANQHLPPVDPATIETSRVVEVPLDMARAALRGALESRGFTVSAPSPDRLTARLDEGEVAWAACPRTTVVDTQSENRRYREAWVRRTQADLDAVVTADTAGRTEVNLVPTYTQVQVNSFTNTDFDVACTSRGVLEQQLLDSIGPAALSG
ncbi:MAG: hypothetical protein ACFB3T_10860 [Geminicoccaceae bacterium]